MAKNPSTTWYFNDWENDPELKTCSLAAQGLWMRLLCIAARSPEHGVVQIGSLTCGLPDGLTHLASAVGRPPQEIAPLIDELLSSGAASQDRKGRLINRRMTGKLSLSAKRAIAGSKGAEVTNGKRTRKEDLPQQNVGNQPGKSRPLQDFQTSNFSSHGNIIGDPPSAPAPDGARSGASRAADEETWRQRLAAYDPHRIRETWKPGWGPRPDAPGHQPLIPPDLLRWWRAQAAQARSGGTA